MILNYEKAIIIEILFGILTTISIFDMPCLIFFLWYADILLPILLYYHIKVLD